MSIWEEKRNNMKRLFILIMIVVRFITPSLAGLVEPTLYSNGDYGFEFEGKTELPKSMDFDFGDGVFDENGNFYCLCSQYLVKVSSSGEILWDKYIVGSVKHVSLLDGNLFVPVRSTKSKGYVEYAGDLYQPTRSISYFLFNIDIETGNVVNSVEIEIDDFVENGFDPFGSKCDGYAISTDGDILFMFDINEDYSRINKDIPVSFERYGNNDKCLFHFSKNLEYIESFCLGSEEDDETEEHKSEHISPYMTFAGDTLYMYIPFAGNECNVSLDSNNPEFAKNKTSNKSACAAFCKYLYRNGNFGLLGYNVISGVDGQIKRFAVNSQNKVVAAQPEKVWNAGDDYYYDILPDLTLHKLEGYAYTSMWSFFKEHTFYFDQRDDIIKLCTPTEEKKYSENIILGKPDVNAGARLAKYDGSSLDLKWVIALDNTGDIPFFKINATSGSIYLIAKGNSIDFDPTDGMSFSYGIYIARYIETYRIKTSSEHVSMVVNEGNDMVRHGSDAEVVISAEKGYHVESVKTSKGENVEVSWNGRCSIKNVTEPVELIITTGLGENSVDQTDAVALSVYPNPVKDLLNVDDADDASFEIIDLSGNIVCSGVVNDGKIVTSELSEGVYVLTINKEFGAYSTKIVKK